MKIFKKSLLATVLISTIALMAVFIPLVSAQQSQVLWEGWTKSRNITDGQSEYTDVTNADPNDVVRVQSWFHNRENPAGPRANNVTVRFEVPSNEGTSHGITGVTTADNAPTISDTTTVNTAPEATTVEYIPGSAKYRYNKGAADGTPECQTGFEYPPNSCYATVSIPDSVVTGGINLDAYRGGSLIGCNAYHETVVIDVVVKAKVVPPVEKAACDALDVQALDNRRVQASIQASVMNAEIVRYEINFGDGTVVEEQSAEHQYAQDGTYNVVGRVLVRFESGEERWITSEACEGPVVFKGGKPVPPTPTPPVPGQPTVLPDTGVGDLVGIFVATSIAGSLAYRFVWARRFN